MKRFWHRLLKCLFPSRYCEHEGCLERWAVKCRLGSWSLHVPDEFYHYCAEHCFENGFCYGCGEFWSGVENFDFSPSHLCSNCRDEFEESDFEDEWYEAHYLPDAPEEFLP